MSASVNIASGVPQGSVLGLLLFTAYVSPISRLIQNCGIGHYTYADGTTLLIKYDTASASLDLLNRCTAELSQWFMHNGLLLNSSKSEVMWTGTRSQLQGVSSCLGEIKIASTVIVESESLKILGVIFDPILNFDKQVSAICSR